MSTLETIIYTALFLLACALLAIGLHAYNNHVEITRLRRNGYRKVAARRLSERGTAGLDFLRMIFELGTIILLLAAVLGWLSHGAPQ